jgi:hypothetical protein
MERAMGIEPTSEAWEASSKNLKSAGTAALNSVEQDPQLENKWKTKTFRNL